MGEENKTGLGQESDRGNKNNIVKWARTGIRQVKQEQFLKLEHKKTQTLGTRTILTNGEGHESDRASMHSNIKIR